MQGRFFATVIATVLLALSIPTLAASNPNKTTHRIPRVNSDVYMDGVLDDDVWRLALVLDLNYEVLPGENIPPPVETSVLLAYDERHLYVGFRAKDPQPSEIRARVCDRDDIWDDDWVAIVLDTFNDERRNYLLACNPFGIQLDMIECRDCGEDNWDGIWDSAGRITSDGYVVEMAIPFSSLRFQRAPEDQVWGVDGLRGYPRSVGHHIGLFPRDRSNNCYLCQAEKLIGFAGATPGKNVEIDPTFSALIPQVREGGAEGPFVTREDKYEPGLTARWGFTPNLTLGATANPDFSQVEADAAQLDINTQFALYYSEKRPFFLEGADYFSTRLDAVHTRTLADPIWGLKIAGKEGVHTIGSYVVRDEMTNLLFPGNQSSRSTSLAMESTASVFRYRRDLGNQYTFGFLATDREGDDYFNRVLGVDGDLRFTSTDRVRFQLLGSNTQYPGEIAADFGQDLDKLSAGAGDVYYVHNARSLDWWLGYKELGRTFRADLGFIPRVDYRHTQAGMDYTWYAPPKDWWSDFNLSIAFEQFEDRDGGLLDRTGALTFTYEGPLQSHAFIDVRRIREAYNGQLFNQNYVHIHNCMSPTGDLSWAFNVILGDHIDFANTRLGKRVQVNPSMSYRLGLRVLLSGSHIYERMKIEGDRLYTANISQATLIYHFNQRTFLRTTLQYVNYDYNSALYINPKDPKYESLFSQFLFSYKINPQTVFFLGYSDNHEGDHQISLIQRNRTFFAKIGYAWVL